MGLVTIRPNGATITSGSPTIGGGSATHNAATSDNSDTTYSSFPDSGSLHEVVYDFADPTIPANAKIVSVTPRVRHNQNYSVGNPRGFALMVSGAGQYDFEALTPSGSGYATQQGITRTAQPDGSAWTAGALISLQMRVRDLILPTYYAPFQVAEIYFDVVYNEIPVIAGTAPNANSTTTRPTFSWSYSDPDGDTQERWRVKVFTAAQIAASGFDPNTSTPTVDTGEMFGSATSWTCTTDLQNGIAYRAYIFVGDANSGGRYAPVTSAGPYAYTTIVISAPAVPTLSVVTDAANKREVITVTDRQNILSANDATFETSAGSWVNHYGLDAASARLAYGSAVDGAYVFDIKSGATDFNYAKAGPYTYQFTAGRTYSGAISFRPLTNARSVRCEIWWYDGTGTPISSTVGPAVTSVSGAWTRAFVTGVAPANTASAWIFATVIGAPLAEHHYIDAATLVPYALNMASDPIFEVDTNADGLADDWGVYNFGSGTIVPSLDSTVVWAGVSSQKILFGGNTPSSWKGIDQAGIAVKNGQVYTLSAWLYASVAMTGDLYTPYGQVTWSIPANTWTRVSGQITATADNSNIDFIVRAGTPTAGTFWVGHAQMELGSSVSGEVMNRRTWLPGDLTTLASTEGFELQRSNDGGATWTTLKRPFYTTRLYSPARHDSFSTNFLNNQLLDLYDYEALRGGVVPRYRARALATVGGASIVSNWSEWESAPSALLLTGWVLRSLTDPTKTISLRINSERLTWTSTERQSVLEALGRANPVVISDVIGGRKTDLELTTLDDATYDAIDTLRRRQEAMLLQSPYGDHAYVRFGPQFVSSFILGLATRKRTVQASFIEVDS